MNDETTKILGLQVFIDRYDGLTILLQELSFNEEEFNRRIDSIILQAKEKQLKLLWIYLKIEDAHLISSLVKKDFTYHTCESNKILLVKPLISKPIIPTASNHTLGVGVVVINEKDEILLIKERHSTIGFKLPGGHIDDAELIQSAVVREVKEETGIDVSFESVISLGHFYPHQFNKSNLYILCTAKALSYEICIEDTQEVLECKWIDVKEYLEDENAFAYNQEIVKAALLNQGFKSKDLDSFKKIPKQYELFFPKN